MLFKNSKLINDVYGLARPSVDQRLAWALSVLSVRPMIVDADAVDALGVVYSLVDVGEHSSASVAEWLQSTYGECVAEFRYTGFGRAPDAPTVRLTTLYHVYGVNPVIDGVTVRCALAHEAKLFACVFQRFVLEQCRAIFTENYDCVAERVLTRSDSLVDTFAKPTFELMVADRLREWSHGL